MDHGLLEEELFVVSDRLEREGRTAGWEVDRLLDEARGDRNSQRTLQGGGVAEGLCSTASCLKERRHREQRSLRSRLGRRRHPCRSGSPLAIGRRAVRDLL